MLVADRAEKAVEGVPGRLAAAAPGAAFVAPSLLVIVMAGGWLK